MKIASGAAIWLLWSVLTATAGPAPRLEIPSLAYTFDPVVEGRSVVHDFVVRNTGEADLEISKVRTG